MPALLVYRPRVIHFRNANPVHSAADKGIGKIKRVGIGVIVRGGIDAVGVGVDKPLEVIIAENVLGVGLEAKEPLGVEIAGSHGAV